MSAIADRNRRARSVPQGRLATASRPHPVPPGAELALTVTDVAELGDRLRDNIAGAVRMPAEVLDVVLATVLACGHLLVEDHPGVGKTQLARTLARSLDGRFSRIQATVDLLPADIIGANIWQADSATFEFRPGPVFANVVLVDEINRATPKTQSGLLEAMEERQVTVDGESRPIPPPFIVIATQNPTAGYDGTYPLPPAQLDRFLAVVSLGYPTPEQEMSLLRAGPEPEVSAVADPTLLLAAQQTVAAVHASDELLRYVVDLLSATRVHPLAAVGASPRAGLLLLAAARAAAALDGREFVLPDDVQTMARPVLTHRIQPSGAGGADAQAEIVEDVLAKVRAR
ncbi:AAA family ATPase [Thermomonospora catenispora]|uniref:AAA family ATPase n=1 Tax=Thermomonospora catenispora TaxID=2493090 RepID=UPI00111DA109|nr:AAA family ATPase [Thermomonospora catenispora]TNY38555.1 AAA family ATPase [Thermomonospora catenispora]